MALNDTNNWVCLGILSWDSPFSSVVERATRNGKVGRSIRPTGILFRQPTFEIPSSAFGKAILQFAEKISRVGKQ